MTTRTAKTTKVVHILGRAQFKSNGYILYRTQAEVDGVRHETHDVTVIDGQVTSCSECKAWTFNHKCCHTTEVQKRENERVALEQFIDQDMEQHIEDGLRLSREAYVQEFDPCTIPGMY